MSERYPAGRRACVAFAAADAEPYDVVIRLYKSEIVSATGATIVTPLVRSAAKSDRAAPVGPGRLDVHECASRVLRPRETKDAGGHRDGTRNQVRPERGVHDLNRLIHLRG